MVQKDFQEIKNIFNRHLELIVKRYNIKLVYVFGSYAKGINNESSDLDIAILLEEFQNPMMKVELIGEFIDIFRRNDIDLVVLNSAKPVLKYQVIKYGKLLFMQSEEDKVYFEAKVLSQYMDMEPFRRTQMKYVNEWVEQNLEGKMIDNRFEPQRNTGGGV